MDYIILALAAVAVILGVLILSKVNKIITMLHTPIVKRVSDTNLKPNRHALSAQEMASRNSDRHESGNRTADRRENKTAPNGNRQERSFNRDNRDRGDRRGDRRNDRRGDRRREVPEAAAPAPVETAPAVSAAPAVQVTPEAPVQAQTAAPRPEGRRPLPPRVQASLPEAPVVAPVVTPAPAVEAPAVVENVGAEFEPSKVRYGRRNVVKKVPLEDSSEISAN